MSKSVSNNVFKKKTGIQNIQAYLESGRSITALEALSNFGIFRLASAIEVLRKRGMSIETEMKEDPNGKTYARYTLGEDKAEPARKFKAGDRVVVVDAYWYEGTLKVGQVHTVTGYNGWDNVTLEGLDYGLFESRFELAPAETPKKELKVGARVRAISLMKGHEGVVTGDYSECNAKHLGFWQVDGELAFYANELEVI